QAELPDRPRLPADRPGLGAGQAVPEDRPALVARRSAQRSVPPPGPATVSPPAVAAATLRDVTARPLPDPGGLPGLGRERPALRLRPARDPRPPVPRAAHGDRGAGAAAVPQAGAARAVAAVPGGGAAHE